MKVAIIGAGNVGATIAYTLILRGGPTEISLIDINHDKAYGEILDMAHGLSSTDNVHILAEDFSGLENADIIINTAGRGRKPDEDRLDLARGNAEITEIIIEKIKEHYNGNSIILVVSNPMDVLTYLTYQRMGLPANKVFGSGTVLDSYRFRYLLSKRFNVSPQNIHAQILGEHGSSCVAAWDSVQIGLTPLANYTIDPLSESQKEKIHQEVISSGKEVIANKGATYYAVSMSVAKIVKAIINNEKQILSVSTYIDNWNGISDVCLSLPCIIGKEGISQKLFYKPSGEELHKLQASAEVLKNMLKELNYQ